MENSNKNDDYIPNIQNNFKSTFHYFIPWKRAQNDPSLVKKGTEIHINPLPFDTQHEELYNIFKIYGEIIDLRIIPRKEKNNCFAFIRFLERSSIERVMADTCIIQVFLN